MSLEYVPISLSSSSASGASISAPASIPRAFSNLPIMVRALVIAIFPDFVFAAITSIRDLFLAIFFVSDSNSSLASPADFIFALASFKRLLKSVIFVVTDSLVAFGKSLRSFFALSMLA